MAVTASIPRSTRPPLRVAGVLLAAGASLRLGTPKQLVLFQGETLLRRAAHTLLATDCALVTVVLGANAERMREELRGLPVETAVCADWSRGMAHSLRTGINAAVVAAADAALIAVVDQPLVTAAHLNRLIDAHRHARSPIVATGYEDVNGVPALFDQALYGELLALEGDSGARGVIARHAPTVARLEFPDAAVDLDHAEDLLRLAALDRGRDTAKGDSA